MEFMTYFFVGFVCCCKNWDLHIQTSRSSSFSWLRGDLPKKCSCENPLQTTNNQTASDTLSALSASTHSLLKRSPKPPTMVAGEFQMEKKEIALFWIMLLYAQSSYFLYIFLYNKKQQNLVNLPPTPNHNAKPPSKDSLILTCCTSGSRASPGGSFRIKKNYF